MGENRHAQVALSSWRRLNSLLTGGSGDNSVLIDGKSLSIADVVAIARYGHRTKIDDTAAAVARVDDSVSYLAELLGRGQVFYGVRTGFGGSATTRSADTSGLQAALMQMQQCGVLAEHHTSTRKIHDGTSVTSMPEAWVRAATVVRCNTLVRGHSAVRYRAIRMLELLLNEDCVPVVPLRGSISASGDLSPLSYIAGVLEGNPKLSVWIGSEEGSSRTLISADQALQRLGLDPISFGPKEALGMINGTAVSAAVGALALHEAQQLAILSQVLTTMSVEALAGTAESFDPFLAGVRPHRGQTEAAHHITGFLHGSRLAKPRISSANLEDSDSDALWQDRYPLRTSTQWMGPLLEDLVLAHEQITIELNSTTDNPVIDVQGERVIHGGNFQAVAVTSAMEKVRYALQMMGRMLFAQSTEIMNPSMSNGLPPNLVFDEPSVSYCFK
ncbi:L-Aspartase-like protein, partial [Xylogone sp. PMI_703]